MELYQLDSILKRIAVGLEFFGIEFKGGSMGFEGTRTCSLRYRTVGARTL